MEKLMGRNLFIFGMVWVAILSVVTLLSYFNTSGTTASGLSNSWLIGTLVCEVGLGMLWWLGYRSQERCQTNLQTEHDSQRLLYEQLKLGLSQIGTASLQQHPVPEAPELESSLMQVHSRLMEEAVKDEKLNWSIEGEAKFGELFRAASTLHDLAVTFISELVKYLRMNQGAVYFHERQGDEDLLVMQGCYAYDRVKHIGGVVQNGEGQVGQCFLEKETIILKKVPADYIHISSGLGEARPNFVLIVPIKTEATVEGIVELAGFKPLEPDMIAFIEKISKALASVIRNLRIDDHTRLLLEESQLQTEQLKAQEEEIRQNMEEMQATQEQLNRQLEESRKLQEAAEQREQVMALTTILSETDIHGTITFVNSKFCEVSKFSPEELIGRPHNVVRHPDMPKDLFKLLWSTIKQGKVFQGVVKNRTKDNGHYWVEATIVPIRNAEGAIIKYVGSRYHIQDDHLAEQLYNQQAVRLGLPLIEEHEFVLAGSY